MTDIDPRCVDVSSPWLVDILAKRKERGVGVRLDEDPAGFFTEDESEDDGERSGNGENDSTEVGGGHLAANDGDRTADSMAGSEHEIEERAGKWCSDSAYGGELPSEATKACLTCSCAEEACADADGKAEGIGWRTHADKSARTCVCIF
jgi:hypothetical protein